MAESFFTLTLVATRGAAAWRPRPDRARPRSSGCCSRQRRSSARAAVRDPGGRDLSAVDADIVAGAGRVRARARGSDLRVRRPVRPALRASRSAARRAGACTAAWPGSRTAPAPGSRRTPVFCARRRRSGLRTRTRRTGTSSMRTRALCSGGARTGAEPPGVNSNGILAAFARRIILHQPLAYLGSVVSDTLDFFTPGVTAYADSVSATSFRRRPPPRWSCRSSGAASCRRLNFQVARRPRWSGRTAA